MAHVPAERCLAIIELLADGARAMPLGEIAERLALPKSGAHRMLATLVDIGWAEKDADTSFYRLSMRLAILGQQFYVATGIPDICQPLLDRLARQCREFARLAVVDGHALVWVAHAQGASGGLMYQPSLTTNTVPLYATASGKAWLATLPIDQAIQIVMKNGGLQDADRYGPNVVRSVEALLRELKTTARRGYGLALSEAEFGVTAVAAAIRAGERKPALGTVSIAGPSARMTEKRAQELAPMVLRSAAELSDLWPLRARAGATISQDRPTPRRTAVA
ncbi:MAG TPA: IclR family transcriptional regulator [Casimicrobiaceae bacterium]|nr:IclR family transcriptional regulator [Casimicrobiaceae bacterium]